MLPRLIFLLIVILKLGCYHAYSIDNNVWEGDVSSDWNNANNWEGNSFPGSSWNDVVYIDPDNYTNAPVLSGSSNFTPEYIRVTDGATLTINSGASLSVDSDISVEDGSTLTINGGSVSMNGSGDHMYITDNNTEVIVNGGTLTLSGGGDIRLGEDHPSSGSSGTSGSPTLIVDGGTVSTDDILFGTRDASPSLEVISGTLTLSDDLVDNGEDMDVTISGGTVNIVDLNSTRVGNTLTMTGGSLNLTGNWSQNGTSSLTGGTVTFNGSAAQSINDAETFYDVVLNNTSAAGVSLSASIIIDNSLTLTDGVINGGAYTVTFNDDATVSGASAASYVDGEVIKIGNEAFTFPLGTNASYNPIQISAPSSASDEFSATYSDTDPDGSYSTSSMEAGLNNISRREYWILDRDAGSSNVTVTLTWDANSGPINDLSDLRVVRWDGSEWDNEGNASTTGNGTSGTITSNAVSSFSPFTLGSTSWNNPLPVEWLYFKVVAADAQHQLQWSTGSEVNCEGFEVQRSFDGRDWLEIAFVPSQADENGNATHPLVYEFVTTAQNQPITYYRLKQIDLDGTHDYSEVVYAKQSEDELPQPGLRWDNSRQSIVVNRNDFGAYELSVIDMQGRQVLNLDGVQHSLEMTLPIDLKPGVYSFTLSVDGDPEPMTQLVAVY